MSRIWMAALALVVASPAALRSQQPAERDRPLPYPLTYPVEYRTALQQGTRSTDGTPGERYWQQWVDYTIDARLRTDERRMEATAEVVYHNRSPDDLSALYVHLYQNLHAAGGIRGEQVEVTGGATLRRVAVQGRELGEVAEDSDGVGYYIDGTLMRIVPETPVPPGGTARLSFDWSFTVPKAGAGARMGWDDDDLFFIAYWYPQMAVYDDVIGWHTDDFTGNAEFYSQFGSYDLTIEAPGDWIVMATGELTNAAEALAPDVLDRLRRAEATDEIVHVIERADFGEATATGPNGRVRWRFAADSVRDVAFSATRESFWDATRTPVGDRDGDGETDYARIDAFWRAEAPNWSETARYAQHAIDFLSRFTGQPYPWPHMTAVEGSGIIGGGMEFPMMTLMGDYNERGDSALYYVTAHELAHMWVPMIANVNETRFSWLDEGTTTFNENMARMEFFPGRDHTAEDRRNYIAWALSGQEGEMMRRSDFHYPGAGFGIASYSKPATVLVALRAVLGEETFMRAYHEFFDRWAFKHPYPYDFWNTFEDVAGRDLDWFWRSWYYESTDHGAPWVLEQTIAEVVPTNDGTRIVVEDRGWIPMPVHLAVTRANGEVERYEIPVDRWLQGRTTASITVPGASPVVRVEIDPEEQFPDVIRDNNTWVARR